MDEFSFIIDKNMNVNAIVMFGKEIRFENSIKIKDIESYSSAVSIILKSGLTITEPISEKNFTNFVKDLTELQRQFLIKLTENKSVTRNDFNNDEDSKGLSGVMRGFVTKMNQHYLPQFFYKYPGKGENFFNIYSLRSEYRNRIRFILNKMKFDIHENI